MKNYLLYFFAIVFCATALPLAPTVFPLPAEESTALIHVLSSQTGSVDIMPTEDYVLGVMQNAAYPYSGETLKAIAVAVRSRVLYCEQNRPVHAEAAVCDNPACCVAFSCMAVDEEIIRAVSDTASLAVLYRGKPAAAMMHQSSGAYTASSRSVYGVSLPYLVEVKNVTEDVFAEKTWDKPTFLALLGLSEQTDLSTLLLGYDKSHRIHTAELGGLTLDGGRFAALLSLPSTCIDLTVTGDEVRAVCYGEGDGVGMSLHGASMLEKTGSDFLEILAFYYPETQVGKAFT